MDDYSLLDLFWTMLWFFLFIAWLNMLFLVYRDIYRSADLSGWGKAGWTLVTVILPLLGVLVYLVARGGKMHERQAQDMAAHDEAVASYIRSVAPATPSTTDELVKLAQLRDSGVLTPDEFQSQKAGILARVA